MAKRPSARAKKEDAKEATAADEVASAAVDDVGADNDGADVEPVSEPASEVPPTDEPDVDEAKSEDGDADAEDATAGEPAPEPEPTAVAPSVIKSPDIGYTSRPLQAVSDGEATAYASTVMVRAVRSFLGVEGDKTPLSEPFLVSRQRYVDLKANGLVVLA